MRYCAQIQATIEVIDTVLQEHSIPADSLLTTYFRKRRYIGSKDRQHISDLFYKTLRCKIFLTTVFQEGLKTSTAPTARLLLFIYLMLFDKQSLEHLDQLLSDKSTPYAPLPLSSKERKILKILEKTSDRFLKDPLQFTLYPWQLQEIKKTYGDFIWELLTSLDQPASFDLRVNTLISSREDVLKNLEKEGVEALIGAYSPLSLRLPKRRPLGNNLLWKQGHIEVQDEGSQLVALLVNALPGQCVWDYCAGAGGKTLAIAATMKNQGRIVATDTIPWRLDRARERLKRAHVHNVDCRVLDKDSHKWVKRQEKTGDRVLVDVPCSGSGTWRRNPDLKWRIQETDLKELLMIQETILKKASPLVKPGGRLIYATCSLFQSENQDQVDRFLKDHPDFSLIPIARIWEQVLPCCPCPTSQMTLQLRPDHHQVDGFFIAIMEREGG